MNLEITNRCLGACRHCLSDCKPDGIDMDQRTFNYSVRFIKRVRVKVVTFGGGEPSMHEDVTFYGKQIKLDCPKCVTSLISNGWFMHNTELADNILSTFDIVQVTYDDRYYPNFVDLSKINEQYPKIGTESHIRSVVLYGRAKDNNIEEGIERTSPFCFNMRSLIKHTGMSFGEACRQMEQQHKFCSWSILPNGDITISESMLCPKVGTIYDSEETITNNIRNMKCTACKYAQNVILRGGIYSQVMS